MHELGITQNIVSIVNEHARGRRVKRVVVEIGALAGIMPDAIEFCFDVVAKGTALEGALLEIDLVEARARCRSCGVTFLQHTPFSGCPCGSRSSERLTGEELRIKEYELDLTSELASHAAMPEAGRK